MTFVALLAEADGPVPAVAELAYDLVSARAFRWHVEMAQVVVEREPLVGRHAVDHLGRDDVPRPIELDIIWPTGRAEVGAYVATGVRSGHAPELVGEPFAR